MKAVQVLGKVVAAIPKVIEVLSLAHNLFSTLLGHVNGTAPVTPPTTPPASAE